MLDTQLHEVVCFLAVVTEWAAYSLVTVIPILLQLFLEESHLDRWKKQRLAVLDLVGDRILTDVLLEEGVWEQCVDRLAESEEEVNSVMNQVTVQFLHTTVSCESEGRWIELGLTQVMNRHITWVKDLDFSVDGSEQIEVCILVKVG